MLVIISSTPSALITANGPTTFCQGDSVVLTATPGSGYLWSTGATSQSIIVTDSGNYSCTVNSPNGCNGNATTLAVSVIVNQYPMMGTISGPTEVCQGSTQIYSLSNIAGVTYNWTFPSGWSQSGLNSIYCIFFTDVNTGYAVGVSGTILKTTNAGNDWTAQTSGTINTLISVYFTDANTGYAVGFNGTILKTSNGGLVWTDLSISNSYDLFSVYFTDSNNGYAVDFEARIIKTTDGGNNWAVLATNATSYLCSANFTNINTGYVVGFNGNIIKTIDGGSNWTLLRSGTERLSSVYFTDANTGYAVGYNYMNGTGTILKTINGGTNWSTQISGTYNQLNCVFFIDADTGYAVGENGIILKTINGGATWITQISGTTNYLSSVYFTDATTGYVTGSYATILKTSNGGTNWISQQTSSEFVIVGSQSGNITVTPSNICGNGATQNLAVTVNNSAPVNVSISSNPSGMICAGENVTFTATPTNGGDAPIYQWKVNGSDVGTNSSSFTSSTLVDGDIISCELISNSICASGNPAISNEITIFPNLPVSIIISANTICQEGASYTYTASPNNEGISPIYQWNVNGSDVGANSSSFSSSTLASGDTVICVLTSNASCISGSPVVTSNSILHTTIPPSDLPFIELFNNDIFPPSCWISYNVTNGITGTEDNWVRITGQTYEGTGCAYAMPDPNPSVFKEHWLVTPRIRLDSSGNKLIFYEKQWDLTDFGATYKIKVSTTSQTDLGSFTDIVSYNETSFGTEYTKRIIDLDTFLGQSVFLAFVIVQYSGDVWFVDSVQVDKCEQPVQPTSITGSLSPCVNSTQTYSVPYIDGVLYNWTLPAGWQITNGDSTNIITVTTGYGSGNITVTPFNKCGSGPPQSIEVAVPDIGLNISVIPTSTICTGTNLTFIANTSNDVILPLYQWKVNGVNTGTNDSSFTTSTLINGDVITCVLTSNISCVAGISNDIVITNNSPGSLDLSFNGTGIVTTPIGDYDWGRAVAVQEDGKIVVAGNSSFGKFTLVRYNTDGVLDNTFSTDGIVTTDFGNYDEGKSIALQSDGKIILAGYYNNGTNEDFVVIRYNTDGTPDSTFSDDGIATTAIGSDADLGMSVVMQTDGKIVVAGYYYNFSYDFAVVRYNANGTLDNTFSGDGKVTTSIGSYDYAYSAALQADGKIIVAGISDNGSNYDFAVVRYNANGTLDNTFSGDGKVTTSIGSSDDFGYSVVVQADGKIIVAGSSNNGSNNDFALVRYNTNGTLDNTFSNDGKVTTDIGSTYDWGYSVAMQADGKIIVAGSSYGGFALVRYSTNGALDSTFSDDGILTTAIGSHIDDAKAVSVQNDGKIVVAGVSHNGLDHDFAVARYIGDGPIITYQPDSQTSCIGGNVMFNVKTSDCISLPIKYQWKKDGSNIIGATNDTLVINNATLADTGSYTCFVSDSAGYTSSEHALLYISSSIPVGVSISSNPSGPICAGTSVTYTATPVNGGAAPAYQWYLNDTLVGTDITYSNSSLNNGDSIKCRVTSNEACVINNPAWSNMIHIVVNPLPTAEAGATAIYTGTPILIGNPNNGPGTISWSPAAGLSDTTIAQPLASPATTTTYTLSVNNNGCIATDTVTITFGGLGHTITGKTHYLARAVAGNPAPNHPTYNSVIYNIDHVIVILKHYPEGTEQARDTSDATGNYHFANVMDGNYVLSYDKYTADTMQICNDINAIDVTLVKYYIGADTITDPSRNFSAKYKKAANVDNFLSINSIDISRIKAKVGSPTNPVKNFPKGNWVAIDTLVTIAGSDIIINLKTICYGDYNASSSKYRDSSATWNSAKSLPENIIVQSDESIMTTGNEYFEVPLRISAKMKDFSALGLELNYPDKDFMLVNVFMPKTSSKNGQVKINPSMEEIIADDNDLLVTDEDGVIRVVFATTNHFNVAANDELVTLGFRSVNDLVQGEVEFTLSGSGVIGDMYGEENDDAFLLMPKIFVQGDNNDPEFEFAGYPNPFSDDATLTYKIPENGTVKLKVYNAIGELVSEVINEAQTSGKHSVMFSQKDQPAGMYTFKLEFTGLNKSKCLILKLIH
ncbi:MAG TPA: YCF48-related protein [Bacteroidales bacterium]|nr:YCF48-related protein [Bacteroidales bacterium]